MIDEIDFVAEHPKADMSKVNKIIVNGKEYVAIDHVLEIIDEKVFTHEVIYFPLATTTFIRDAILALKKGEQT